MSSVIDSHLFVPNITTYFATGSICFGHSKRPSMIFSYILKALSSNQGGYLKKRKKNNERGMHKDLI